MDAAYPGWELSSFHLGPVLDVHETVEWEYAGSTCVHVLPLEWLDQFWCERWAPQKVVPLAFSGSVIQLACLGDSRTST